MLIDEELRALILMSSLPSSWETFMATMIYVSSTRSILSKDTRRKSFEQTLDEAYSVESAVDQPRNCGRSSSGGRATRGTEANCAHIWNYCKKLEHIKAQCRALQAKNEKAQKTKHKGKRTEEVNYCGSILGPKSLKKIQTSSPWNA